MKYVYFMRPIGMDGPVKIGCSDLPERRLLDLAAWSPFPLEIVARTPGSYALEKRIHDRFAEAYTHREWFRPVPDLLDAIKAIAAGASVEDAIDFTKASGRIAKKVVKFTPARRVFLSYARRLHYATRRADRLVEGGRAMLPKDCEAIMQRWQGYGKNPVRIAPSPEELARLEQVIRDPSTHCVSVSRAIDGFIREARAS